MKSPLRTACLTSAAAMALLLLPSVSQARAANQSDDPISRPETTAQTAPDTTARAAADTSARTVPTVTDTIRISFPRGSAVLDENYGENAEAFSKLGDLLDSQPDNPGFLHGLELVGGASPEGSLNFNVKLSEKRANSLADFFFKTFSADSSLVKVSYIGRDWEGLLRLAKEDPAVPFKKQTINFLRKIVDRRAAGIPETDADRWLAKFEDLKDGGPYYYMSEYLFPKLRSSQFYITHEAPVPEPEPEPEFEPEPVPEPEPEQEDFTPVQRKNFYMDFSTNLLYDAFTVPNVSVEFYLGKRWSIEADWMYSWWKSDNVSWYCRNYGGNVTVRKWMGKKSKEKPLQGHHLGIYGQMLSYDFEYGGKGVIGDRWNWGAGLEYGYSLPVARRLNIDFSIGVGYVGGKNQVYEPEDGHYYYIETRKLNYIGPTRAEISLVWLIGRGNYNADKGRKAAK